MPIRNQLAGVIERALEKRQNNPVEDGPLAGELADEILQEFLVEWVTLEDLVNPWQDHVNLMYTRGVHPPAPSIGEFPSQKQKDLCVGLIEEEVNEELLPNLRKMGLKASPEELTLMLDDVVDSIWVLVWAARAVGITNLDPFFDEVGASNNAKIPDTGPIKHPVTGKLQKPSGWEPPRLRRLVDKLLRAQSRDPENT